MRKKFTIVQAKTVEFNNPQMTVTNSDFGTHHLGGRRANYSSV
jgi:hypothetical protein